MNVLIICNQNKNRSKTAQEVFSSEFSTKSAGLYNQKPVTEKELVWADMVVVMEDEQRAELARRFPELYLQKRILSLGVPDIYEYGNPILVEKLNEKMAEVKELF